MKLIFKAKVKLESGNQKIQYGRQAAILTVTSLKINRLLPMATINMYMKFEIEIPKQTWLMLRKPCRLQTDGRTDRRTDGQTDKVNPVYPPSNFVGRGYKYIENNVWPEVVKFLCAHKRVIFGVYFLSCETMRKINTKITLEWAYIKQFMMRVHTLFNFLHDIMIPWIMTQKWHSSHIDHLGLCSADDITIDCW